MNNSNLQITKIFKPSPLTKSNMIKTALIQNKVSLTNKQITQIFINLIPNYEFINNEIKKLSLLNNFNNLSIEELDKLIFNLTENNIFELVNLWLMKKFDKLLLQIKGLINSFYHLSTLLQIFSFQVLQIKLFLLACKLNCTVKEILINLQIPIFQQKKISKFLFIDGIKIIIDKMLLSLYNICVKNKLNINLQLSNFICILLGYNYE